MPKRSDSPYSERTKSRRAALLEARARAMREAPTPAEARLWEEFRGGRLGVRFVRQAVVGEAIVDFLAPAVKLVVEVDGEVHRRRTANDARRDAKLARLGYRVLRVTNDDVEKDLAGVVARIRTSIARAEDVRC